MPRYKNVAGIAREVSHRYLNVGGIAREVSKGYTNINGVAREYYSNGVVWRKYSCLYEIGSYTFYPSDSTSILSWHSGGFFYPSYTFHESSGFTGEGDPIYRNPGATNAADVIGMYSIQFSKDWRGLTFHQQVFEVKNIQTEGGSAVFLIQEVAEAEAPVSNFEQSPGHNGDVIAEEGALPEEGILIEGSPQDSYCIVVPRGDSEPYYYVKQQ